MCKSGRGAVACERGQCRWRLLVRPDVRRKGAGGHAGDELIEGLGAEILEYSALSFFPGIVQDAGRSLPAGAVLHDAVEYPEEALDRLRGFAERYLVGRASRQPPPRPCSVSTSPERESLARIRASKRRGTRASDEILAAVICSPDQAR
jgi:hypothetical protein